MKVDRLYGITVFLMNHGRTSARSLAKHFEVSVRTIQREMCIRDSRRTARGRQTASYACPVRIPSCAGFRGKRIWALSVRFPPYNLSLIHI